MSSLASFVIMETSENKPSTYVHCIHMYLEAHTHTHVRVTYIHMNIHTIYKLYTLHTYMLAHTHLILENVCCTLAHIELDLSHITET